MLKVGKFHLPTASRFDAAQEKPIGVGGGGGQMAPILDRVKKNMFYFMFSDT